jgi:hypothetical protein
MISNFQIRPIKFSWSLESIFKKMNIARRLKLNCPLFVALDFLGRVRA